MTGNYTGTRTEDFHNHIISKDKGIVQRHSLFLVTKKYQERRRNCYETGKDSAQPAVFCGDSGKH